MTRNALSFSALANLLTPSKNRCYNLLQPVLPYSGAEGAVNARKSVSLAKKCHL
jgi:hypothetical protein